MKPKKKLPPKGSKKPKVNLVQEASDDDYCLIVKSVHSAPDKESPNKIFTHKILKDNRVKFHLDSSSTINTLPEEICQEVMHDQELKQLTNTGTTLVMFNNPELQPFGSTKLEVQNPKNNVRHMTDFLVVSKGHKALLGVKTIQLFQLMTVNLANIMLVFEETPSLSSILDNYNDVFSGKGKLEEKLHLTVDPIVPTTALPVRKIPLAIKEPLKKEIDRLVCQGILKPVDTPTDWVSSMVVVLKSNGKIRLCIDPKPLNQALKGNH